MERVRIEGNIYVLQIYIEKTPKCEHAHESRSRDLTWWRSMAPVPEFSIQTTRLYAVACAVPLSVSAF